MVVGFGRVEDSPVFAREVAANRLFRIGWSDHFKLPKRDDFQ
jgi:hypothetical protein